MKTGRNTKEELNTYDQVYEYDHDTLARMVITYQKQIADMEENHRRETEKLSAQNEKLMKQIEELDSKLQKVLEQIVLSNQRRFGRSSEKIEGQLAFEDVDGVMNIFNETEKYFDELGAPGDDYHDAEEKPGKKHNPSKYPRKKDIDVLPHTVEECVLSEEELGEYFGDEGYKELPPEIQYGYRFVPASLTILERRIHVYSGKRSEKVIKAPHPKKLLRNSLATANIVSAVMTAKYANALPFERQQADFGNYGANITTQDMSYWSIQASDRYLSVVWDYMKGQMIRENHVIHADETPAYVNRDGRGAGSKSSMWVYRSGEYDQTKQVVLYEYQKTRQQAHPQEFLKDYKGICVTDGYQVYHNIEDRIEGLKIAGCWAHMRRKFKEASDAASAAKDKSLANNALKMIQAVYREEGKLKDLETGERLEQRQLVVRPLVEAYFAYIHECEKKKISSEHTKNAIGYAVNQEKYMKVFLEDGQVPIDNNAALCPRYFYPHLYQKSA